jgi:curved DNA-binding protein CbpA
MNLVSKNYYELLEISPDASFEDVHRGYARAKNTYSGESIAHYSLISNEDCKKMLNDVEEAFSILSIPEKRREYDKAKGFNNTQKNRQTMDIFAEDEAAIEREKAELKLQRDYNHKSPSQQSIFQGTPSITTTSNTGEAGTHSGFSVFGLNNREEMQNKKDFTILRNSSAESSKLSATNRFTLRYEVDHQFEQEIETMDKFTGSILKKIREYKKVTVERMSDMTRVSKTYIKYIENDEWEKLPAFTYTRGFIFQYAKCLRLNPDIVANSYMSYLKRLKEESQKR